ncbi:hypothetical protein QE152_g24318 [Popillia japonica]|uniref:Uncharacterized protein n=1 Tax=Popillia japonica TaxID=7064 RepID=A0AAW1KGE8_POPJA
MKRKWCIHKLRKEENQVEYENEIKSQVQQNEQKENVKLRKEENQVEYENEIKSQVQQNEQKENVDEEWINIKNVIINAVEKSIRREAVPRRQAWFESECEMAMKNRRKGRLK